MKDDQLRLLLDRAHGVQHACDLDLLLFFHRHPRSLLTSEQLAASVGYERERVARSIEGLIEAGYLTRSPNPAHSARLYVVQPTSGPSDDPLRELLRTASTRPGRQRLLALLDASSVPAPEPVRAHARARLVKIA